MEKIVFFTDQQEQVIKTMSSMLTKDNHVILSLVVCESAA